MKISQLLFSSAERRRRCASSGTGQAAFTMVEIALCLAIIGFALVAIIGVLPTGLNVQKDNREETIIDQDVTVWMDAIRNGARGYDDLTNYVMRIENYWSYYNTPNGPPTRSGVDIYVHTNSSVTSISPAPNIPLTNGLRIIGLLSMPKLVPPAGYPFQSNYVVAYVLAMSGSAVEKPPQKDDSVLENAFGYKMIVEVAPYVPFDTNTIRAPLRAVARPFDPALPDIGNLTNVEPVGWTPAQRQAYWDGIRVNRRAMDLAYRNTHDLRLTFRWPLLPNNGVGNGRHTFRLLTGGGIQYTNDFIQPGQPLYFFEPPNYVQAQ